MSKPRATIILRRQPDRRVKISLWTPDTTREIPTGIVAGPEDRSIRFEVERIKVQLEKSGTEASVREM